MTACQQFGQCRVTQITATITSPLNESGNRPLSFNVTRGSAADCRLAYTERTDQFGTASDHDRRSGYGQGDMSQSRRRSRSQFFLTLDGDVSETSDLDSPVTGRILERLSFVSDVRLSLGSDVRSERLSVCSEVSIQTVDSSKSRSQFYVDLPSDATDASTSRTPVPEIKIDAPDGGGADGDSIGGNSGNVRAGDSLPQRCLTRCWHLRDSSIRFGLADLDTPYLTHTYYCPLDIAVRRWPKIGYI